MRDYESLIRDTHIATGFQYGYKSLVWLSSVTHLYRIGIQDLPLPQIQQGFHVLQPHRRRNSYGQDPRSMVMVNTLGDGPLLLINASKSPSRPG